MTDQQYQCPLCDYTAGKESSVAGHIRRKTDKAHKGQTKNKVGVETIGESDSDDTSGNEENSDGNPAMGGPDAPASSQGPDSPDTPDPDPTGTELPCGCETVDMSDVEPPVIISCDTCGREYPYE